MSCQQCGCRLVAKSATSASSLVCADCGHPVDGRSLEEQARRSWRAALALLGFGVLSGLILSFAVLLDLHNGSDQEEPARAGQLE